MVYDLQAVTEKVEELRRTVYGNGKEGINTLVVRLSERVNVLTHRIDTLTKMSWAIILAVLVQVVAAVLRPVLGG